MQRRIYNRRKGATLIEFALVLLPLLAIVFGSFEMDRMLLIYTSVANSARAGVRYAIVHGHYNPPGEGDVEKVVRNFASMGLLDTTKVTVTVTYEDGTDHIGSPVSVSVAYLYDPFTSFFPLNATLRSTAKGTIAF